MPRYREVGEIFLRANDAQYRRVMNRVKQQTARDMQQLRKIAMQGAIGVFGAGMLVKVFADQELALSKVQKVSKLADRDLAQLGANMRALSRNSIFATRELLETSRAIAQLGITEREAMEGYTDVVARMGTATVLSGEQAAFALARISGLTNTLHEDVERVASSIVQLGNTHRALEDEIAENAINIAAAVSMYGLTAAEVNAIAASVAHMGLGGAKAATAIGKAMQKMNFAMLEGGDKLMAISNIMGTTASEAQRLWAANPADAFNQLVVGLHQAGDEMDLLLHSMDMTDDRTNRVIKALAANEETLARALKISRDAFEQNTALALEYSIAVDNLWSRTKILINRIIDLAAATGAQLAPAVEKVVKFFSEMFATEADIQRVAKLAATIIRLGATILAMKAGLIIGGMLVRAFSPFFILMKAGFAAIRASTLVFYVMRNRALAGRAGLTAVSASLAGTTAAARVAAVAMRVFWGAATLGIATLVMFLPEIWGWLKRIGSVIAATFPHAIRIFTLKFSNAWLSVKEGIASTKLMMWSMFRSMVEGATTAYNKVRGVFGLAPQDNPIVKFFTDGQLAAQGAVDDIKRRLDENARNIQEAGAALNKAGGEAWALAQDPGKTFPQVDTDADIPKGAKPESLKPTGSTQQVIGGDGAAGSPWAGGGRQDPRKFHSPYDRQMADLARQEREALEKAEQEKAEIRHRYAMAEFAASMKEGERLAKQQEELDADERARLEYKLQTEKDLLEMHQRGLDEQELEFYERERELQAERDALEAQERTLKNQAELLENQRQLDALAKQRDAYYKDKAKADLDAVMRHLGTLSENSSKAQSILAAMEKARALIALAGMPVEASKAKTLAEATIPPPAGQVAGYLAYARVMAEHAVAVSAAAKIPGARRGGRVEGAMSLRDSQVWALEPGELVVPRRNFDQVVHDAAQRMAAEGRFGDRLDGDDVGDERELMVELVGDAGRLFRLENDRARRMGA